MAEALPDQGMWTLWPCEHGNVTSEPGFVPQAHRCAVCGAEPVHVVPAFERDRLAGEVERLERGIARIAFVFNLAVGTSDDGIERIIEHAERSVGTDETGVTT